MCCLFFVFFFVKESLRQMLDVDPLGIREISQGRKELEEGELIFMLAPKCGNAIGTSGTKQ